jgi:hypothetical protein
MRLGASELNREAMPPSRISREDGCQGDSDSAHTAWVRVRLAPSVLKNFGAFHRNDLVKRNGRYLVMQVISLPTWIDYP